MVALPLRPARIAVAVAAAAVGLALAPTAWANTEGTTQQNLPYVTGGVTAGEVAELRGDRRNYALEVITAAKDSGAYIAAVQIELTRADGTPVLTTELDGPYLLVDLEPGRYVMVANHEGQTQRRTLQVGNGSRRQVLLYFDDPARLSPDLVNARERGAPGAWLSSLGGPEAAAAEARQEQAQQQNAGTTGSGPAADPAAAPSAGSSAAAPAGDSGSASAPSGAGNGNAPAGSGSAGSGATGSGTSAPQTGAEPSGTSAPPGPTSMSPPRAVDGLQVAAVAVPAGAVHPVGGAADDRAEAAADAQGPADSRARERSRAREQRIVEPGALVTTARAPVAEPPRWVAGVDPSGNEISPGGTVDRDAMHPPSVSSPPAARDGDAVNPATRRTAEGARNANTR